MLRMGLKEQTYETTGTYSAELAATPAGRAEAVEQPMMLLPKHLGQTRGWRYIGTTLREQRHEE